MNAALLHWTCIGETSGTANYMHDITYFLTKPTHKVKGYSCQVIRNLYFDGMSNAERGPGD